MSDIMKYETTQGAIQLSPKIVRQYLVNGQGNVTDQEVMMFMALCKYQQLNPFLREAYLIKYGNEPATIITGKDVFTKRAAGIPDFAGFEAGVIVLAASGELDYHKGTLVLPGETLVGGWAKIYRKNWTVPLENTVSLDEYIRRKKDGEPMANWKSMPATMIRKVALVQALREAFPDQYQGMYSAEEMPVDVSVLSDKPVAPITNDPPVKNYEGGSSRPLSEAQIKRMYAISKANNISTDMVKAWLEEYCEGKSSKELTKEEYDQLCTAMEDGTMAAWWNAKDSIDADVVD